MAPKRTLSIRPFLPPAKVARVSIFEDAADCSDGSDDESDGSECTEDRNFIAPEVFSDTDEERPDPFPLPPRGLFADEDIDSLSDSEDEDVNEAVSPNDSTEVVLDALLSLMACPVDDSDEDDIGLMSNCRNVPKVVRRTKPLPLAQHVPVRAAAPFVAQCVPSSRDDPTKSYASASYSDVERDPSLVEPSLSSSLESPQVHADPRKLSERFSCTLNNYTEAEVQALKGADAQKIFRYVLFGFEIGDQGTPHLQCYFELKAKTQCSLATLQKRITAMQGFPSRYAVAASKGTGIQNFQYCTKDGDFFEWGTRPKGQGKRSDLDAAAEKIAGGETVQSIALQHPGLFIKYGGGMDKLWFLVNNKKRTCMTFGYWLFGPSGTGKSRWAIAQSGVDGTYPKDPSSKWWDGYRFQETVVIDDYRPNCFLGFAELLRLADRYPKLIEHKGTMSEFNSSRVIITSPHSIRETFKDLNWMTEGSLFQLERRFQQLEFGVGKLSYKTVLSQLPPHPSTVEQAVVVDTVMCDQPVFNFSGCPSEIPACHV